VNSSIATERMSWTAGVSGNTHTTGCTGPGMALMG
jgi:hypothetical protein